MRKPGFTYVKIKKLISIGLAPLLSLHCKLNPEVEPLPQIPEISSL